MYETINNSEEKNIVESNVEMVYCTLCGEDVPEENAVLVNGRWVCNTCAEERVLFCEECGEAMLDNDCEYVNGRYICCDCLERGYVRCVDCDEWVAIDYAYETHDGDYVCESCRYDNWQYCYSCDCLHPIDDMIWDDYEEEYFCHYCYNRRVNRAIKNYSYKPEPIFYGGLEWERKLYIGVELEVDNGGEDNENAKVLLNTANANNEHIYIKHDGSICNGFEIVSHPATLEYHTNNLPWHDIMREALEMGYRSHDTQTCGLHCHVSRYALGSTRTEQDEVIAKIIYFVENNWSEVLRFTRRTEANLARWASRYGIEKNAEETYKKAKQSYNRYRCVNLENDNTIEFRMFRGTLKYSTFIATLQLVTAICEMCITKTTEEIERLRWGEFVNFGASKYPELTEYLHNRNLI